MQEKPLVSVIVPVYNVKAYLKRCVYSIVAQSYKNLEILLIDDGSTDESGRLCDELSQQDDRIRVFHQANKGLSGARNKGLDEMRGDWVLFVDSDDYISPDCIEVLYSLTGEGVEIVSGSLIRTKKADLDFEAIQENENTEIITGRKAIEIIYGSGPKLLSIVACGKLFGKNCFQKWRFREGIIHEDEELMWKLLYECNRIAVTQQIVYAYFMTANSIMRGGFSPERLVYLDILAERAAFFEKKQEKRLFELTQKTRCYALFDLYIPSRDAGDKNAQISASLKKEFNSLFPDAIKMKAVNRKAKVSLFLMRFAPPIYKILKR